MQDLDPLKYFLVNLGLHNLVLVVLSAGLGALLGRLIWARSAQGLVQLRERLAAESERAMEAERRLKLEQDRFRELRDQVESAEGGTVVINSPELDEELTALREREKEADATLEQMMLANAALEGAVQALEGEKEARERESSEEENDEADKAGLRAEMEVLRGEAKAHKAEREALELAVKRLRKDGEKVPKRSKGDAHGRVAALELQLLEARHERKQVEEASAILRKELYAMRHELEKLEKRQSIEKELDLALRDAEQRLTRLQAEAARSAKKRAEVARATADEPVTADEPATADEPVTADEPGTGGGEAGEVVRLPVEAGNEGGGQGTDDLTRIKGIGAVLARRLGEAGVTRYAQIAGWTDAEVKEISARLSLGKRVEAGNWQEQARDLMRG